MLAAVADHLWQSACCFCLLWMAAAITRSNAAHLRLWIWRIGALKFVVPFALLFAIGKWWGFPVEHTSDEPPRYLLAQMREVLSWSSPAQAHDLTTGTAALACLALVPLIALCAWRCRRGLTFEGLRTRAEDARLAIDPDDRERSIGFVKAFVFTVFAIALPSSAFVGGALTDRVHVYGLLLENSRALLDARIDFAVAKPGMGERVRVDADAHGVTIRNANLQNLVALAYGVNHYAVINEQMVDKDMNIQSWMLEPRYDLRVTGPVTEPSRFDAYALHGPITRLLAHRFGYELYVNGKCQAPCGRWAAFASGLAQRTEQSP
jgi:hypothetical protein